jgi:nitrogen fixation NifU-like protein
MKAVYGTTVLEHFRRPRNHRALERPTASHEGFNHQCGDRVRMEVEVDGLTIREAGFTANACAICTASASLLTERITGADVADVRAISETSVIEALGEIPQGRRGCATLPLETLHRALAGAEA